MKQKIVKAMFGLFGALMLVGCTNMFVTGQEDRKNIRSIEGVWQTVVTPRNCASGAPLGVTFPGILMFSQGGTMTGTSTAVTSVYGTWSRDTGSHNYSFTSLSFKYDGAGNFVGSRKITQNLTLDDTGNSMTTNGGFQDYDVNGNPTISGCSTATGTRFE
jgi:hypothetical protein